MWFSNFQAVLTAAAAINNCAVNQNSLIYKEAPNSSTEYYMYKATQIAISEANDRFPNDSDTGKKGAFRNGFWNALLNEIFGETNASIAATTYETSIPNYDSLSLDMDLINNNEGRSLTNGISFSSYDHCANIILNAIKDIDSEFKIILDNKLVPSSYVGKIYVISKSCDGVTRVRSEASFFSNPSYGWVPYGEVVLDLGKNGPFTKVLYYTSSGLGKTGYIYTKYLQSLEIRYQPTTTDSNGVQWYNPYSDGFKMTQAFNDLDTGLEGHLGHDMGKSGTNVPVKAICGGTVVARHKYTDGNGHMVIVRHVMNGKEFYSFYSHMKENSFTVSETDSVTAGQQLGIMGSTGNSGGPHIHLGVYTGALDHTPNGYFSYGTGHIIAFDEDDSSQDSLATDNALIKHVVKNNNTYYDFLEVIRTEGSIIV